MTDARIIEGDCIEVMAAMDPGSADAVVTDPPYGLAFMGKAWDSFRAADMPMRRNAAQDAVNTGASRQGGRQRAGRDYQRRMARDLRAYAEWCEAWASEALRVLKPGGHLLAFGGTRTHHRLICGIEDAGFEIRDTICWLYGTGFPKSHDVSKAIDRATGAERDREPYAGGIASGSNNYGGGGAVHVGTKVGPTAVTDAARAWDGWGTALKPAHEPVVVARKPLNGTVAGNVTDHGTGALNIDAARIAGAKPDTGRGAGGKNGRYGPIGTPGEVVPVPDDGRGRWPANVALDPEAAAMLDEQSGDRPGGNYPTSRSAAQATGFGIGQPTEGGARAMGDTGGASRFFYVAKASSQQRPDRGESE